MNPRKLEHGFRRIGVRGMRILMFQLSGFYYRSLGLTVASFSWGGWGGGVEVQGSGFTCLERVQRGLGFRGLGFKV